MSTIDLREKMDDELADIGRTGILSQENWKTLQTMSRFYNNFEVGTLQRGCYKSSICISNDWLTHEKNKGK